MNLIKTISDHLNNWSDNNERKIKFSTTTKKNNTHKKPATSRSSLTGICNRTLQALWQAWMQVCQIAGPWSEVLSFGQQAQTKTSNGLHSSGLSRAGHRICRQFSPNKNDFRRVVRNKPRTAQAARKTLARSPPQPPMEPADGHGLL